MTRPLSNDLLERVVAAVIDGESSRSVASRFGVAVSSVVKWSQRYRATARLGPARWADTASGCWSLIVPSSRSGSGTPHGLAASSALQICAIQFLSESAQHARVCRLNRSQRSAGVRISRSETTIDPRHR